MFHQVLPGALTDIGHTQLPLTGEKPPLIVRVFRDVPRVECPGLACPHAAILAYILPVIVAIHTIYLGFIWSPAITTQHHGNAKGFVFRAALLTDFHDSRTFQSLLSANSINSTLAASSGQVTITT